MTSKARVNLTMDAEVIRKAKALGLNISKISENAILSYIERLEGVSSVKKPENSPKFHSRLGEKKMVGGAGIEPATLATSRRCHTTRPPAQPRDKGSGREFKVYRLRNSAKPPLTRNP